jgi:hypothetical protein
MLLDCVVSIKEPPPSNVVEGGLLWSNGMAVKLAACCCLDTLAWNYGRGAWSQEHPVCDVAGPDDCRPQLHIKSLRVQIKCTSEQRNQMEIAKKISKEQAQNTKVPCSFEASGCFSHRQVTWPTRPVVVSVIDK